MWPGQPNSPGSPLTPTASASVHASIAGTNPYGSCTEPGTPGSLQHQVWQAPHVYQSSQPRSPSHANYSYLHSPSYPGGHPAAPYPYLYRPNRPPMSHASSSDFNHSRRVQVRILAGFGLKPANHVFQGLSDPYCEIVNRRTNEIRVSDVRGNTVNPSWHQTFFFNDVRLDDVFDIYCWDYNIVSQRVALGRAHVPVGYAHAVSDAVLNDPSSSGLLIPAMKRTKLAEKGGFGPFVPNAGDTQHGDSVKPSVPAARPRRLFDDAIADANYESKNSADSLPTVSNDTLERLANMSSASGSHDEAGSWRADAVRPTAVDASGSSHGYPPHVAHPSYEAGWSNPGQSRPMPSQGEYVAGEGISESVSGTGSLYPAPHDDAWAHGLASGASIASAEEWGGYRPPAPASFDPQDHDRMTQTNQLPPPFPPIGSFPDPTEPPAPTVPTPYGPSFYDIQSSAAAKTEASYSVATSGVAEQHIHGEEDLEIRDHLHSVVNLMARPYELSTQGHIWVAICDMRIPNLAEVFRSNRYKKFVNLKYSEKVSTTATRPFGAVKKLVKMAADVAKPISDPMKNLTRLGKEFPTWKIEMFHVKEVFGSRRQHWNTEYPAAQKIFEHQGARNIVRTQHAALYGAGILGTSKYRMAWSAETGALCGGDQFLELFNYGVRGRKPRMFTYVLKENKLYIAETGANFFMDMNSKHAMHANADEEVVYAGELHFRMRTGEREKRTYILVVDNNSGTYAPAKEDLPRVREVFRRNFANLEVQALDFKDPRLKEYTDAYKEAHEPEESSALCNT